MVVNITNTTNITKHNKNVTSTVKLFLEGIYSYKIIKHVRSMLFKNRTHK